MYISGLPSRANFQYSVYLLSPVNSVNLAASPAEIMVSSLVSYKGFIPPFHICKKGLEQEAVTSRVSNSIQELAGKTTSEYSMEAVISMSDEIINSILGFTFLIK